MSKELPYFKFEPSEWQNGDIQMCDFETQIRFLDICCAYWSRVGVLPYAYVMQKLCGGNANALNTLEKYQIIKLEGELIRISFLDRQLEELQTKSEKARESAEKRWKAAKNDANALKTQCERNANRREEKRIEENKENKFNFRKELLNLSVSEEYINDWLEVRKRKKAANTSTALQKFMTEAENANISYNEAVKIAAENSWAGFKAEWLNKQPQQKQLPEQKSKIQSNIEALKGAFDIFDQL